MTRDEAIRYNEVYQEVALAIANIRNLGFDTKELENDLKVIHNQVTDNVKVKYVKGMAEASYIQSYSGGIFELNKLKNKLDKYDVYVKAYNKCNTVDMKINKGISEDELARCVSKIISVLKSINKSPTIDYDNEKHIVEKIYETAYNLIKLEILVTGESQLFLFVKNEDTNISYFNNLIIGDIEKIDLQDEKNKLIKAKLFELGENGIYSNYLDLELVKLILLSNENVNLQEIIINKINELCNQVTVSDLTIKSMTREIDSKKDIEKLTLIDFNELKKKYNKRLTSFVLATAIFASGFIGIPFLARREAKRLIYSVTSDIYSSVDESYTHNKGNYLGFYGENDNFQRVYLAIHEYNKNDFEKIDLSYLGFEDLHEYVEYLSGDNDILTDEQLKKTEYYEVKMEEYQRNPDSYQLGATLLISLIFYLIFNIIVLFDGMTGGFDRRNIKKLKKVYEEFKSKEGILNDNNDNIYKLMNELMEEINKNDELRNKFNELYEANKFLLDNPEELYKRINDITSLEKIENAKRLVKENKKSR